jgi:hypothetical protein
MNIDQELERLHKSFQINQEFNKGDRSGELIFLIDAIYSDLFGTKKYRTEMDMSLKQEMSKIACKDDEVLVCDNHGFDIPEGLQPIFDKFKRFLQDNNAEEYWGNIEGCDRDFFNKNKVISWIIYAFCWKSSKEGSKYWHDIEKKWQESLE